MTGYLGQGTSTGHCRPLAPTSCLPHISSPTNQPLVFIQESGFTSSANFGVELSRYQTSIGEKVVEFSCQVVTSYWHSDVAKAKWWTSGRQ